MKRGWALFVFSCVIVAALPPSHAQNQGELGPIEEELAFESAYGYYEKGEYEEARGAFQEFLEKFPTSPLVERVFFHLGEISLKKSAPREAVDFFTRLLEEFPSSFLEGEARYQLGLAYLDMGDLENGLSFLGERLSSKNPSIILPIYEKIAEIYVKRGEMEKAIEELVRARQIIRVGEEREKIDQTITEIINSQGSEKRLYELLEVYPKSFPGDVILIKIIELHRAGGDSLKEEKELRRFLARFPRHPFLSQAKADLTVLKERVKGHRFIIGVLVPKEKEFGFFSTHVLNGALLALSGDQSPKEEMSVGLVVREYGQAPSEILSLGEEMVNEYKPVAVIGPLLSREVRAISSLAEEHGVLFFTPSAIAPDLPGLGRFIFRDALTPHLQAVAMAEYAVKTLGLLRFVILYPKDAYGTTLMEVFSTAVTGMGGEVIHAQDYPPEKIDFGDEIARLKEVDLTKYGKVDPQVGAKKKEKPRYTPGFEAVFLPGEAKKVGLIVPQLIFHDIKNVIFLGDGGWNSEELLRLGGRFMEGGIFVDGFFLESPDPVVKEFRAHYQSRYQEEPTLFSAQSYDGMRMILDALEHGATTGQEIRQHLLKIKEFPGASGLMTMTPVGEAEKKLFLIQIKNGQFVQIN